MIEVYKVKNINEYEMMVKNVIEGCVVIGEYAYNDLCGILNMENLEYKYGDNETILNNTHGFINPVIDVTGNSRIIFCLEKDDWYWISYYHAKLTNSEIIIEEDVDRIINKIEVSNYKYVTITGSPQRLTQSVINKIQMYQATKWGSLEEFYFGILTARNIETFSFVIAKNDVYKRYVEEEKSMIIDRTDFSIEEIIDDDEITILGYKNATVDNLKKYLNKASYNYLSIVGHGRDDIIWMTEGSLCAKSKYQKQNDSEFLPSCAYVNECFRDNMTVMPMWSIKVKHIFACSCFSLKTNEALFGLNYSLLYSALDGNVVSYLGSPNIVDGKSFLNYFYIALLKSGFTLGESSGVVNRTYWDYGFGFESGYFLVGDPTFQPEFNKNPYRVDEIINLNSYQEYNVPESYLIIIKISDNSIVKDFFEGKVRIIVSNDENQKIYGVLRCFTSNTYLYLFSNGKIKAGKVYISVKLDNKFDYSEVENLEYINVLYEKIGQEISNEIKIAKQIALNVCCEKKENFYIFSNTKKLYNRYKKYQDKSDIIQFNITKLLNDLTDSKGFSFGENCISTGLEYKEHSIDLHCNNCGRQLYIFNYAHPMYKGLKRTYYMCPICGYVLDYSGENVIETYFKGNSKFKIGECFNQTLYVKNKSMENKIRGYGGIRFASGQDIGATYDNEIFKIDLAPGEEKEFTSLIKTSDSIKPHSYWLKANLVLGGNVWVIKKDLWLIK
ncbi:hypothetical protein KPL47_06045 [Clostridium estertheticum]|uniref:hypothetical protein n=1 Tax=Clostridium estertheticum TaxID=238834 RepID=UPI001C0B1D78|nr:hypothetical protein [Clostridium estertheticum]MBU3175927.1 hypothetical protein [Clostridium estertheticum]